MKKISLQMRLDMLGPSEEIAVNCMHSGELVKEVADVVVKRKREEFCAERVQ